MKYNIDLFAVFIFLGLVQACFLSFFFLSNKNRKEQSNLFFGFLLICLVAVTVEIFLMYTGYIINCLFLVDFSDPFGLAIGPLFYLTIISITRGPVKRKDYIHMVFPIIYALLAIPIFIKSEDLQFNSWVSAYNLDLPFRSVEAFDKSRPFWITAHPTEVIIISLLFYSTLIILEIARTFYVWKESIWAPVKPLARRLQLISFTLVLATLMTIIVKYFNLYDTGDHIIAAYISFSIYLISFWIISQSGFFKPMEITETQKYKNSLLSKEDQQSLLKKLNQLMTEQKPFLRSDFSLPALAHQMNTSVHTLSQAINDGLGKTFFELTAEFRVEEAMRLLKEHQHIKVEEIAARVGYNSKSSFNNAFKKITGKTPSEYRGAYG